MSRIIFISLAVIAIGTSIVYHSTKERERRLTLAQHSFATGCYTFAQGFCPTLPDPYRDECYKIGFENCEPASVAWKAWLTNDKNGKEVGKNGS